MTSASTADLVEGSIAAVPRRGIIAGRWSVRRGRLHTPYFSVFFLSLFVVLGAIGPMISPYPPGQLDVSKSLLPPAWTAQGTTEHLLGTDQLGRDVLSRLLSGARISLIVAIVAVLLSGAIGVLMALIAGHVGGRVDAVITRITDASIAFPILLLAIVIVGVYGPSTAAVIVILTAAGWPQYTRVLRSEVLSLNARDFIHMAKVMGGKRRWVMRRHLLPNVAATILVLATLQMGGAIIAEGSLSFLGIGVPPPAVSWGGMLADGRSYLTTAWWLSAVPGIALSVTVLSANVVGDWLRVRNDPARRR